jgi:hypothetical protein
MVNKWIINIQKGASYIQTITVSGIADISAATNWRIVIGNPGGTSILEASVTNGLITSVTGNPAQKVLSLPPTVTSQLEVGNYRFDFDVVWGSSRTERLYALGQCLVQPEVPK